MYLPETSDRVLQVVQTTATGMVLWLANIIKHRVQKSLKQLEEVAELREKLQILGARHERLALYHNKNRKILQQHFPEYFKQELPIMPDIDFSLPTDFWHSSVKNQE